MKQAALYLCTTLALLLAACQQVPYRPADGDTVQGQTDRLFEKLVDIRRDLHQHPEPAGQEVRTAATVAAHLRALGLEVHTGQYGHSVVAVLRGALPGRTVAWRAELDALPGDFRDPAPFRSRTAGVHHACGHDVHIAIALGIAEVLSTRRQSLRGTAVFVFQPEEETFKGAQALLERGVFASTPPDEIYGLHVTALPVGDIVVRAGEMFAHQRRVRIRLRNELTDAQLQQLAARVQGELSRARPGARPWEIGRAGDPVVGLAAPATAFQDYLIADSRFDVRTEQGERLLEFNLYETNARHLDGLPSRIERVVEASGHRQQLLSVSYVQANPTVHNDGSLTDQAIRTLQRTRGAGRVRPSFGQAPFFNDDFAWFQQRTPGVYFFLGGSNADMGIVAMNHAPDFQVDEQSIRFGVARFASLLLARLGTLPSP